MTDKQLMDLVDHVATWSGDTSSKIGAVLTVDDEIVAMACNDLPVGVDDLPERRERPAKYLFTEHAERNVIFDAAFKGVCTAMATLYTTGVPCADCARAVIQSGITDVVVWANGSGLETTSRWYDSIQAGRQMLIEAGVEITEVQR